MGDDRRNAPKSRGLRLEGLEERQLLSATPYETLASLGNEVVEQGAPAPAPEIVPLATSATPNSDDLAGIVVLGLSANSDGVVWNDEGRLVELTIANRELSEIDLFGFDALTKLDVSGCVNLRSLDCPSCALTELDVSGCPLRLLDCSGNALTELDLSDLSKLKSLYCGGNELTELDLSNCPDLETLDCSGNALTELDLSGCSSLSKLDCSTNYELTELDLSECPVVDLCFEPSLETLSVSNERAINLWIRGEGVSEIIDAAGASVDFELWEDDYWRAAPPYCRATFSPSVNVAPLVCSYFDDRYDGTTIQTTSSFAYDAGDLAAIEALGLTAESDGVVWNDEGRLVELTIADASLTQINISGRDALTKLDVSGCANLTRLSCHSDSALTELNVSGCDNLQFVECFDDASLTSLDFSGLASFNNLNCMNCSSLTSLDVSGCRYFQMAMCNKTALSSVDLTGVGYLGGYLQFYCQNGTQTAMSFTGTTESSTTLALNGCANLQELNCEGVGLTSLNLSGCSNLTNLDCSNNKLTSLDVSGKANLTVLACQTNDLTELNVSGCENLYLLSCWQNDLTELDLTGLSGLQTLYCDENGLESLDLSDCSNLIRLTCDSNNLVELDLSGLAKLYGIRCNWNGLTTLNLSDCAALLYIDSLGNNLAELDLSDCLDVEVYTDAGVRKIVFPSGSLDLRIQYISELDEWDQMLATSASGQPVSFELYEFESNRIMRKIFDASSHERVEISYYNDDALVGTTALVPSLATPTVSASSTRDAVVLRIGEVEDAENYVVEYGTDPAFATYETRYFATAGVRTISGLETGVTYYFRVKATAADFGDSDYEQIVATTGFDGDECEPNNSRAEATELGTLLGENSYDLNIHSATDVDWLKFSTEFDSTGRNYVSANYERIEGVAELSLALYDADGALIAESADAAEPISLYGLSAGDYYVRVRNTAGKPAGYQLNLATPASATDAVVVVTTNSDDATDAGSLRYAIENAYDGDVIVFDASLQGQTITLAGSELVVDKAITIDASAIWDDSTDAPGIAISGNSASRIFNVAADATFVGLSLTGGAAENGGAIASEGVALTVSSSVFDGNAATNWGGAIFVNGGTFAFDDVSFINNGGEDCGNGGALFAERATGTVQNSLFDNNYAKWTGGAADFDRTSVAISDTTVIGNVAGLWGGGFDFQAQDVQTSSTMTNVRFENNSAHYGGGAFSTGNAAGISVVDSQFVGNTTSGSGGAINMNVVGASASIVGSTFSRNQGEMGGAIDVLPNTTLVIENSTFTDNESTDCGGAIHTSGNAFLQLSGSELTGNLAANYGGAVDSDGQSTLTNTVFTGNSSGGYSGVAHFGFSGSGTVANCSMIGNSANHGGAITVRGTATISDSTFEGNVAEIGGALRVDSGTLTLSNSTLTRNIATSKGGAIKSDAGSLTIAECVFTNNTSITGGALNSYNPTVYEITDSTFSGNAATGEYSESYAVNGFGGAIYLNLGSPTISRTTFTGNESRGGGAIFARDLASLSIVGGSFSENVSKDVGGAIYLAGANSATIQGASFADNVAISWGGAIRLDSTDATIGDSTFENNTGTEGGAIKIDAGAISIDGCDFEENSATGLGGAIQTWDVASLTVTDSTFTNNATPDSLGGGIYAHGGTFAFDNLTFEGNRSNGGGGSFVEYATGTVDNSTYVNNNSSAHGGAAMFDGASVRISGATVTGNVASVTSGGFDFSPRAAEGDVEYSVSDSTFLDNSSGTAGGAISAWGRAVVTVADSRFEGNSNNDIGGAINADCKSLTVTGSEFVGNQAVNGGAVRSIGADLTIDDCEFSENVASNYGAGIQFIGEADQPVSITNSTFSSNTAGAEGGAIKGDGGIVVLRGDAFADNQATGTGGAVQLWEATELCLEDSSFARNQTTGGGGSWGGALFLRGPHAVFARNAFEDNYAAAGGGALNFERGETEGDGSYSIADSTFTNNSGPTGGAISSWNIPSLAIANSTFTNNEASDGRGGGVFAQGGTFAFDDLTFVENQSSWGASVFVEYSNGTISESTFTDNTSIAGSAGIFDGTNVEITGVTATGNSATESGAAFVFNSKDSQEDVFCSVADSTFANNSATYTGGAISGMGLAVITIEGSRFEGNSTTDIGGAINADCKSLTVTGSEFVENQAVNGGAVRTIGANLTVDDCEFSENVASNYGAAVQFVGADNLRAMITNSTFSNNEAGTQGAAFKGDGGTVVLRGDSFTDNRSTDLGGAVQSWGASGVYVEDSLFARNQTSGSDGGAIFITGSQTYVLRTTFEDNYAFGKGGAFAMSNANATFYHVVATGNRADQVGGAFYLENTTNQFTNGVFANNSASRGGAFDIADTGSTNFYNSTFYGNSASQIGGAFGVSERALLALRNSIIVESSCAADSSSAVVNDAPYVYALNVLAPSHNWSDYGQPVVNYVYDPSLPLFVDAENGDFHLDAHSQALDRGDNSFVSSDSFDLDNNPRIAGDAVDLGAYERFAALPTPVVSGSTTPTSIVVRINEVEGAEGYVLEYSTAADFADAQSRSYATAGVKTITDLVSESVYYVRVKAFAAQSSDSDWATLRLVPGGEILATPTLAVSATKTALSLEIGEVAEAASYLVEYGFESDFSDATAATLASAGTFSIDDYLVGATYYFRAKALGSSANDSKWGTTSATVEQLAAPVLSAVASTDVSLQFALSAVGNASGYVVEYSLNDDFSDATSVAYATPGTKTIDGLEPSSTYYFRATALASGALRVDSDPSAIFAQETADPYVELDAPVVSSWISNKTAVVVTIVGVEGGENYVFQYGTDPTYASVSTRSFVGDAARTFSGLEFGANYYFRVKASGTGYNDSEWTEFAVTVGQLSAPVATPGATTDETIKIALNPVANAVGYAIEYSASEDFSDSTVVSYSTYGTKTIDGLEPSSTYYFRAKALGDGENRVDSAWSTAISQETDEAYVELDAPTVSGWTSAKNSVSITIAGVAGGEKYVFQYGTDESFSTFASKTFAGDGAKSFSDLDFGSNYYFRVKATGTGYKDSAWTELTVLVGQLPAPSATPGAVTDQSAKIAIASVSNASGYAVEYSTSGDFSDSTLVSFATAGTKTIDGLEPSSTYYFRVKALGDDETRVDSEWSEAFSQETDAAYVELDAPVVAGTTSTKTALVVTIDRVEGGEKYLFQYGTDPNFESFSTKTFAGAGSKTFSGLDFGAELFFRVKATGAGYRDSAWTEFTATVGQLSAPTATPAGVTDQTAKVAIAGVANASGYAIEYSTSEDFSDSTVVAYPAVGTKTIADLEPSSTYYFRVKALGDGESRVDSEWSEPIAQTTADPYVELDAPTIASLASTKSAIIATIAGVEGGEKYAFQYGTDPNFEEFSTKTFVGAGAKTLSGLEFGATYYLRTKAIGAGANDSEWSEVVSIQVGALAPPVVSAVDATPEAIQISLGKVSYAVSYLIEYSQNADFSDSSAVSYATYGVKTIAGLEPNSTYYFRAMVFGDGENRLDSGWSDAFEAQTAELFGQLATPAIQTLVTTQNSISIKLSAVENAAKYVLEYGTDPTFENCSTKTFTSAGMKAISDLEPGTTYYLRLKATGTGYVDSDWIARTPKTKAATSSAILDLDAALEDGVDEELDGFWDVLAKSIVK